MSEGKAAIKVSTRLVGTNRRTYVPPRISMPYKDPIKKREHARIYADKWRRLHPERRKELRKSNLLKAIAKDPNYLQNVRQYKREWKEKNKDLVRRYRWKSYGMDLTVEKYNKLFSSQQGVCAICSNPPITQNLHADHNHKTGQIRGLLCGKCNRGLGYLGESIANLRKALDYLEYYENQLEESISHSSR